MSFQSCKALFEATCTFCMIHQTFQPCQVEGYDMADTSVSDIGTSPMTYDIIIILPKIPTFF
jgi:hypothetical protein